MVFICGIFALFANKIIRKFTISLEDVMKSWEEFSATSSWMASVVGCHHSFPV